MQVQIHEGDKGAVLSLLKYAMKSLDVATLRAALSGKDGVAAVAHAGFVCEFIVQAEVLQGADSAHEVAQAGDVKATVDGPGFVAHTDDHGGAATVSTGLGFDGRNYLLIVGAWACPINDLRLHSSLSGCDLAMLTYAAKYLHKAAGADVVAGDLI